MDISVEELLLLENLTYIDSNFREAIGKDLDIASYKTVGQMLDQFTPEVMDKLIQCGDQTVDGGLTSGYEWAAMIQSMKNNPNLYSLKIDRESTAMHGGDAGKTKAICFVKPDGKAIVAFRGTLVKTSGRIMCIDAESANEFDDFIAKCKELSFYDTGVTAEYGDKLITLSTCEYSRNNSRLVVVAKRITEDGGADAAKTHAEATAEGERPN